MAYWSKCLTSQRKQFPWRDGKRESNREQASGTMKDFTQGSVPRHLLVLAAFILGSMAVQALYLLVDIYFVGHLGQHATAGVSVAGSIAFLDTAITQVLGVSAVSLAAGAAGRKDREDLASIFRQFVRLALLFGSLFLLFGYAVSRPFFAVMTGDGRAATAGIEYLNWYLPGLALQFLATAVEGVLRGIGLGRPTLIVQMVTVAMNTVLTPVLVAGHGTGIPLGVAGAGLATTCSVGSGVVLLLVYVWRSHRYLLLTGAASRARWWLRGLHVGLPAGAAASLTFLMFAIISAALAQFGSDAQAAFGIGARITQVLSLPMIAVASAMVSVAGQNLAVGLVSRVRATFCWTLGLCLAGSLSAFALCQQLAALLVRSFSEDPSVIGAGATYLKIVSINFIGQAAISSCVGLFQATGNTLPAFFSSAARVLCYSFLLFWISRIPGASLDWVWYASVASLVAEAVLSGWFATRQLRTLDMDPAQNSAAPIFARSPGS